MKKTIFPLIIISVFALTSCDRAFMRNDASNDGIVNFESMWKQLNEKYSFFEYKNIDWDSVYNVYKPKIYSDMEAQELFDVLAEMMNSLRDGHSNLFAPFDYSRNWSWYLDYPANFDQNILERNYLGTDYSVTGPFKHKWLENNIAYIYYGSFSGSLITQEQWDYIANKYANCKAIIFDIRNNGGGYMSNVEFIGSQLIDADLTFGYYKVKNGPNHNDFSEKIDYKISPAKKDDENGKRPLANKDFFLLTNRHCFSAANFFAMLVKELPNATIIGDYTGGGGGLPMDYQLPNGWTYRFSATATYTTSDFNIEHGIEPNIKIDMSSEDIAAGKDSIIEKALSIIKEKK